eukprot:114901-Pelagomonas_calceolata.AAC.4
MARIAHISFSLCFNASCRFQHFSFAAPFVHVLNVSAPHEASTQHLMCSTCLQHLMHMYLTPELTM